MRLIFCIRHERVFKYEHVFAQKMKRRTTNSGRTKLQAARLVSADDAPVVDDSLTPEEYEAEMERIRKYLDKEYTKKHNKPTKPKGKSWRKRTLVPTPASALLVRPEEVEEEAKFRRGSEPFVGRMLLREQRLQRTDASEPETEYAMYQLMRDYGSAQPQIDAYLPENVKLIQKYPSDGGARYVLEMDPPGEAALRNNPSLLFTLPPDDLEGRICGMLQCLHFFALVGGAVQLPSPADPPPPGMVCVREAGRRVCFVDLSGWNALSLLEEEVDRPRQVRANALYFVTWILPAFVQYDREKDEAARAFLRRFEYSVRWGHPRWTMRAILVLAYRVQGLIPSLSSASELVQKIAVSALYEDETNLWPLYPKKSDASSSSPSSSSSEEEEKDVPQQPTSVVVAYVGRTVYRAGEWRLQREYNANEWAVWSRLRGSALHRAREYLPQRCERSSDATTTTKVEMSPCGRPVLLFHPERLEPFVKGLFLLQCLHFIVCTTNEPELDMHNRFGVGTLCLQWRGEHYPWLCVVDVRSWDFNQHQGWHQNLVDFLEHLVLLFVLDAPVRAWLERALQQIGPEDTPRASGGQGLMELADALVSSVLESASASPNEAWFRERSQQLREKIAGTVLMTPLLH